MTSRFCVVGSPIAQSLSPVLHAAAYKHLRLDFSYEAHQVEAGALVGFLQDSNFDGVSVTMPLKSEAFELSVGRNAEASLTKVSNTLTRSGTGWAAANTDIYGLCQALSIVSKPSCTTIVGAGSTSSSALVALAQLFPDTQVVVAARDEVATSESVEFGRSLGLSVTASKFSVDTIEESDLVLSLVPAGSFVETWSKVAGSLDPPRGWLFDASYNPWPTLPAAAWRSERAISGLEMLIWQAIEQVAIFSASVGHEIELDRPAMYEVMKAAVSSK